MKGKLFTVVLTEQEREEWRAAAKAEGRTMASMLRRAMTQYLERQRGKND